MAVTNNNKPLYFLYARKSSESEDRQVQSIEDQVKRLKELAENSGLQIKEILTEAKSAKKPYNRPVFSAMLKRIEQGEAQGILCWQINRLSRNPIDSGAISWMLQQGTIHSIQTIDKEYLPDDNVLLFNVESGIANQYIIDLRKNCRRGMVGRAERGWYPAQAPLGYANDKQNRCIVPNKKYFPVIRRMWDLMLSGKYNPEQIRSMANTEWGFRSPRHKQYGDKELSTGMVYKLFGNIFYTGMFEWAGTLYQGKHKPMITLAEYDLVQMMLGRKGNPRLQHHEFAYTGIIRCSVCLSMVTASEKMKLVKSKGVYQAYTYYHCTHKNRKVTCHNRPVTLAMLEELVDNELEKYTIAPEFLDWALKILDAEQTKLVEDKAASTQMLLHTITATESELTNLTRMRYKSMIDDATFVNEKNMLNNNLIKLRKQLEEQRNDNGKLVSLTRDAFLFAAYARESFRSGNKETKRCIVQSLGSNYELNDKKLLFKASVWLLPIEKEYPELYAEYMLLELQKGIEKEVYNAQLSAIIQRWCAIVEDVRTAIQNHEGSLFIPNLNCNDQQANN